MKNVLLVDLSSIVYPLFHMSGREPDPNWTSDQAVARVHALTSSFQHVAVCLDGSRSFRKDISAAYKANRPDKDAALLHQLKLTEERLTSDGFPMWKVPSYEADDVIASAVNALYDPADVSITIATADKDLLQLVCEGVAAKAVMNGGAILDTAAVVAKYGVRPDQMRDFLTLVGDSSDNISGVPGIGPKKAADLLSRFDRLDTLLDKLADGGASLGLQPAVYKALTESGEQIALARELVTLRADAPIDFTAVFHPRTRAVPDEDTMSEPLQSTATIVDEEQPEVGPSPEVTKASAALATSTPVTDVEPFTGAWERQLEPRNPADARTIAKWLHASRLFAQYGSPEAVFSIVLAGRELGLGTMASLRGFHVVEGKPTMAADLIRALVLASGKAEYFACKERGPKSSTWETRRKGDPFPVALTFTFEEAVLAKLIRPNSAWDKHPADMLAKTASAKLSRLVYADVTFGLYATEELGGEE